jgi:hypothetical protein
MKVTVKCDNIECDKYLTRYESMMKSHAHHFCSRVCKDRYEHLSRDKGYEVVNDMVIIPITKGMFAKVDVLDIDLTNRSWNVLDSSTIYYAYSNNKDRTTAKSAMHRIILSRMIRRELFPGEQVDHINHDGLDNRRCNLRLASASTNTMNGRKTSSINGKLPHSIYKGAHRLMYNSKKRGITYYWSAQIQVDGKHIYLGCFDNEVDAAKRYDDEAKKLFGEFTCLNFPD